MDIIQELRAKAKTNRRRIVLPEGDEPRTVQAAAILTREGIVEPVLVGDPDRIRKVAGEKSADISKVQIVHHAKDPKRAEFIKAYFEARKHKGITEADAEKQLADPLTFGIMMLNAGLVDGYLSGADHATGDTVRPALQIVKADKKAGLVSSFFIMVFPNKAIGENGILIFADCAIKEDPSPANLAGIAVASARAAKILCGFEPKVAMLSYSTAGSAKSEMVDKVKEATRLAREAAPDLQIDGEMQGDAALVPAIGQKKFPGSKVAGKANVLIFPDLNAGNIGYKLAQRLTGAEAIGPILTGFNKPVNDLSRGCSVDDIVTMAAITAMQTEIKL
ncbi:MAG: phosphate acetyltransferase [Elusimicrobia bacterium]|nr:phosphate acetyltransferase [Elusimicrobiota bacterium]